MNAFLFVGFTYLYVITGVFLGAVMYITDKTTSTIGMQYFKMLIVLLFWPFFLAFSRHLRVKAREIFRSASAPNTNDKISSSSPDYWEDLEDFLSKQYTFETPKRNRTPAAPLPVQAYYFAKRSSSTQPSPYRFHIQAE